MNLEQGNENGDAAPASPQTVPHTLPYPPVPVPYVKPAKEPRCCFCVPLRSGVITIASLALVGSVAAIITWFVGTFVTHIFSVNPVGIVFIVQAALVLLQIPFAITGIVGAAKKQHRSVLAYFCWQVIAIVVNIACTILLIVVIVISGVFQEGVVNASDFTDDCTDADTGTVDQQCAKILHDAANEANKEVKVSFGIIWAIQILSIILTIYWSVEFFRLYRVLRREQRESREAIPS